RQSAAYQRLSVLDYQEANEEVGFKGTMALGGCLMLWVVIGLLIASVRYPWAGWLVLPLLIVYVGLQFLRYVIPAREPDAPADPPRPRRPAAGPDGRGAPGGRRPRGAVRHCA